MMKTTMMNQCSTTSTTNVSTMNHMEPMDDVPPLGAPPIPAQPLTSTTALIPITTMMISKIAQPFCKHLQTLDNFHCNLQMLCQSLKQFTVMLWMLLWTMTTTMLAMVTTTMLAMVTTTMLPMTTPLPTIPLVLTLEWSFN